MNSARKPSIAIILTLAALGLISACQRSHMSMGSESHFLLSCHSDAACGPLSCISGTCTAPCDSNNECARLAPDGVCLTTAHMQSAAVPFACGVSCDDDAALCSAMSPDLSCRSGQCMPQPGTTASATPALDAGTALPETAAGAGGSGTVASSSETPPATVPAPLGAIDPSILGATNHCGMTTPFAGDDACLAPPDPALGIQIHIGPRNYDDAELAAWVLQPGDEVIDCWSFIMPNDEDARFAEWEFSARPSLHAAFYGIDAGANRALISDVNMHENEQAHEARPGVLIAEREQIARQPIATGTISDLAARAHAPGEVAVHTYNFTDTPQLRELWLNLYYASAGTPIVDP